MSERAIAYAWREIARRAGFLVEASPVRLVYADSVDDVEWGTQPTVVVRRMPDESWDVLHAASDGAVPSIAGATMRPNGVGPDRGVPFLFAPAGVAPAKAFRLVSNTCVVCEIDLLALTFCMLTRWEELQSPMSDAHGRFPAAASLACRQGFLDVPVVDEYALILRAWIERVAPAWRATPSEFRIALSHDIDRLRSVRGGWGLVRRLVGDLVRRRSIRGACSSVQASWREARDRAGAPEVRAARTLADAAEAHGFRAAFYFIAARPSATNGDYDVRESFVRTLILDLVARGHAVGMHAGYETICDAERMREERLRIAAVLPVAGSRQHYLRFRVPDTWRALERCGFEYDTSLGFPAVEGFRCGTSHEFDVFDVQEDRMLALREFPLVAMDVTLRDYRRLGPDEAVERVILLARRCRDVGGVFSLLWHNTSLGWPGWSRVYDRILDELVAIDRAGTNT